MDKILSWKTYEFDHYEKGAGWYLTLGLIGLLLIAYEIYLRDWMAVVTLIFAMAAIYLFSRLIPREIEITLNAKGISVANVYYPYTNIKRFWMVYHEEAQQLQFETTAYLNRFVIVPLGETDPAEVSGYLKKHLPESAQNRESVAQRVARKLKF